MPGGANLVDLYLYVCVCVESELSGLTTPISLHPALVCVVILLCLHARIHRVLHGLDPSWDILLLSLRFW